MIEITFTSSLIIYSMTGCNIDGKQKLFSRSRSVLSIFRGFISRGPLSIYLFGALKLIIKGRFEFGGFTREKEGKLNGHFKYYTRLFVTVQRQIHQNKKKLLRLCIFI